jgi:glycosyltransferase involved in cell wall biosynthesis
MTRIAFVCPTHKEEELHDYTVESVRTFFQTTANGLAIVVDDASEGWEPIHESHLKTLAQFPGQECFVYRFPEWGGLTRSWNQGLRLAREFGADYVVCGNNDVIFPQDWYQGLLHALSHGYQLAGPVSNAPGISAYKSQQVWHYFPDYVTTNNHPAIDSVQRYLSQNYMGDVVEGNVNGFFQMAHMSTWWEGRYDDENVYRPHNPRTSKGHKNHTPLMTLNEDELQGRWRKRGWRTAICPSSFIFHYRAITRGDKHKNQGGRWFRKDDMEGM